MNLLNHTRQFLENHQITGRVITGVSGGVDSMVLLYILKQCGLEPVAAHVNYKTRGVESDADEEMVTRWCQEQNLSCEVLTADCSHTVGNFQQWARQKRYTFFHRIRSQYDAQWIATAHHRDDQVETLLQKVLRGASPQAWQGIAGVDDHLIRPLIEIPKSEIIAFAKKEGIAWRDDATNQENNYARNVIRNEWVPRCNDLFPGWTENILRLQETGENYNWMLNEVMSKYVQSGSVSREWLLSLPQTMRRTVLVGIIKNEFPEELSDITRSNLESLHHLDSLQTGKKVQLTPSLFIVADREVFTLQKMSYSDSENTQLSIEPGTLKEKVHIAGYSISTGVFEEARAGTLALKQGVLGETIKIRRWQQGDRIQPLGMKGSQKVSDVLTNKKISAAKKDSSLVVVSFEGIISAVIFPQSENHTYPGVISEKAKCRSGDPSLIIEKV